MPSSGTVSAGGAVLASQYNDLRDDVLDPSTGHTHMGSAGYGAQIPTGGLEDGAVTEAKLGTQSVSWERIGSGGLYMKSRFGGDADEWGAPGTAVWDVDNPIWSMAGCARITVPAGVKTKYEEIALPYYTPVSHNLPIVLTSVQYCEDTTVGTGDVNATVTGDALWTDVFGGPIHLRLRVTRPNPDDTSAPEDIVVGWFLFGEY
jgi:hypothetical protein